MRDDVHTITITTDGYTSQDIDSLARKFIARKFGEHESGQVILKHDNLRYIVAQFALEFLDSRKPPMDGRLMDLKIR